MAHAPSKAAEKDADTKAEKWTNLKWNEKMNVRRLHLQENVQSWKLGPMQCKCICNQWPQLPLCVACRQTRPFLLRGFLLHGFVPFKKAQKSSIKHLCSSWSLTSRVTRWMSCVESQSLCCCCCCCYHHILQTMQIAWQLCLLIEMCLRFTLPFCKFERHARNRKLGNKSMNQKWKLGLANCTKH